MPQNWQWLLRGLKIVDQQAPTLLHLLSERQDHLVISSLSSKIKSPESDFTDALKPLCNDKGEMNETVFKARQEVLCSAVCKPALKRELIKEAQSGSSGSTDFHTVSEAIRSKGSEINIEDIDLSGIEFSESFNLNNANARNVTADSVRFKSNNFTDVNFSGGNFKNTTFTNCDFTNVNLARAQLSGATLQVTLNQSTLDTLDLSGLSKMDDEGSVKEEGQYAISPLPGKPGYFSLYARFPTAQASSIQPGSPSSSSTKSSDLPEGSKTAITFAGERYTEDQQRVEGLMLAKYASQRSESTVSKQDSTTVSAKASTQTNSILLAEKLATSVGKPIYIKYQSLANEDCSGKDLRNACFVECGMTNINFTGARLDGASLQANMDKATLDTLDLSKLKKVDSSSIRLEAGEYSIAPDSWQMGRIFLLARFPRAASEK